MTVPAIPLSCHPSTPCPAVRAIEVRPHRAADGALALAYRLSGDIARLRIPSPALPARIDGLWQHTCCEAFVADVGSAGYREFNFAPSGEWAAYAFADYRQRHAPTDPDAAPLIAVRRSGDDFELVATIPAEALPRTRTLAVGLSVVVEDGDGGIAYWALRHPAPRPDFHHRDAFALTLEFPA